MKRLTLVIGMMLALTAGSAQGGVLAGLERWLGIHYGRGIHAMNGCGPNQANYNGYGWDAYPEEIPPGISEIDELQQSRRPVPQRSTRAYPPRPATR